MRRAWVVIVLAASPWGCRSRPHPTGALPLSVCALGSAPGSVVEARCGTLQVPARWPEDGEAEVGASRRAVELRVAVVPARREPTGDAVVFVPDGPGRAATAEFPEAAAALDRVRESRDVILVDHRGASGPGRLRCAEGDAFDPEALPVDGAVGWAERCVRGLDLDPRLYATSTAVRDLEAVRVALGYERLSLVGVAYGGRLALAYARRYPDRVRVLVLAGAVPVEVAFGGDADLNARNALNAVMNRCERDAACARAYPGARDALPRLAERLERAASRVDPPRAGSGFALDAARLRRGVLRALETSARASRLPSLAHAAEQGRLEPLIAFERELSVAAADRVDEALRLTVLCSEDVPFFGGRPDTAGFLGESLRDRLEATCRVWPRAPVDAKLREPLTGETPALVVSGTADPTAPPRYGDLVASRLRRTVHLVLRGLSHDVLLHGCVPSLVATFVDRGGEGGLDATCVREVAPPAAPLQVPPGG